MNLKPEPPALSIRVRGQLPLDLNRLLRMSANQRGATKARRGFQADQRVFMRAQNSLPRTPLEGPFHVRYCRIHEPRNAVDIDNAAAGLKTILDGLAEEKVILHDGHGQIPEIDRVWQVATREPNEVGFFLELVRPGGRKNERALWAAACSLLSMAEKALGARSEEELREKVLAAVEAARAAGLGEA